MTSKVASLPEITGDAALLVDPLDIRGMTKAIRIIDTDNDLRVNLGRRALSGPSCFRQQHTGVAALYRSVLG